MSAIDQLERVRQGLLRLHKALLEAERVKNERAHGRVASAGAFLQIVISDPALERLHRLSELVVPVGEAQEDQAEPWTEGRAKESRGRVRALLAPGGDGVGYGGNYCRGIQREAGVGMLHGEVSKLL